MNLESCFVFCARRLERRLKNVLLCSCEKFENTFRLQNLPILNGRMYFGFCGTDTQNGGPLVLKKGILSLQGSGEKVLDAVSRFKGLSTIVITL